MTKLRNQTKNIDRIDLRNQRVNLITLQLYGHATNRAIIIAPLLLLVVYNGPPHVLTFYKRVRSSSAHLKT